MKTSAHVVYKNLHKIPLIPLLSVVVIMFSVFITSNLAAQRQVKNVEANVIGADLFFISQQSSLSPETTGVVDVYAASRNDHDISAVDLEISVSSSIVEITDIEVSESFPYVFVKEVTPTSARIVAGVDPTMPVEDIGYIGQVVVTATDQTGSTNLVFSKNSEVAVVGFDDNALGKAISTTLIVE